MAGLTRGVCPSCVPVAMPPWLAATTLVIRANAGLPARLSFMTSICPSGRVVPVGRGGRSSAYGVALRCAHASHCIACAGAGGEERQSGCRPAGRGPTAWSIHAVPDKRRLGRPAAGALADPAAAGAAQAGGLPPSFGWIDTQEGSWTSRPSLKPTGCGWSPSWHAKQGTRSVFGGR
jgi:hypothetical protein